MQDDLNRRFAGGQLEAFEEAIERYGEKLLRYACAILCDYHEAEDVVQEVFVLAMKNWRHFDGSNLSAWLYKITYRTSLNRIKRAKPLLFGDLTEQDLTISDVEMGQGPLWEYLSRLMPKERALLYARIYEGRSYAELSKITGTSQAALRKRYERARKKLAESLMKDGMTGGNAYENDTRAEII